MVPFHIPDDRDGVFQRNQRLWDWWDALLRPGHEPAQSSTKERLLLPPVQKRGKCKRSADCPRGWGLRYLLFSFFPSSSRWSLVLSSMWNASVLVLSLCVDVNWNKARLPAQFLYFLLLPALFASNGSTFQGVRLFPRLALCTGENLSLHCLNVKPYISFCNSPLNCA